MEDKNNEKRINGSSIYFGQERINERADVDKVMAECCAPIMEDYMAHHK